MKKKNLKFILLVVLSSLISFEAFASTKSEHEIEEQQVIDVAAESNPVEISFAEDVSIDITNDELDDVLNKAYAAN